MPDLTDLIARVESLYGERCPDYDPNCATCVGWEMIDQIAALRAEVERLREVLRQDLTARHDKSLRYLGGTP